MIRSSKNKLANTIGKKNNIKVEQQRKSTKQAHILQGYYHFNSTGFRHCSGASLLLDSNAS